MIMSAPSQPPQYYPVRSGTGGLPIWAIAGMAALVLVVGAFVLLPFIANTGCTTGPNGATCATGSNKTILGDNNVWIVADIYSHVYQQTSFIIQVTPAQEVTSCNWIFCQTFTGTSYQYSIDVSGPQNYVFPNINLKLGAGNDHYEHSIKLTNPTPPDGTYTVHIKMTQQSNSFFGTSSTTVVEGTCSISVPLDAATPTVCVSTAQ